jgi:hypothetical protein
LEFIGFSGKFNAGIICAYIEKRKPLHNNNILPITSSEPTINKMNYASNLMAFTKEFNILILPRLILLLDYKVHTTINITRFGGLEVCVIE